MLERRRFVLSPPDFVVVGLRAAQLIAVVQTAGVSIFIGFFARQLGESGRAIRRLGFISGTLACFLVVTQHALEPARMTASFSGIWNGALQTLWLESNAGAAHAVRLAGLVLIVGSATVEDATRDRLGLMGAIVALGSFTLMGHTVADEQRWLLSVLLLMHLLTAAFWFGALAAFGLASRREAIVTVGELARRFSMSAGWLVPLILVAGVGMATLLLPGIAALGAPYGLLLLGKLLGFVVLLMLAAWNKFRLGPEVAAGSNRALTLFRRVVAIEWLGIAAVLALTAVMTALFGPD